jgi:hypothetical protein
VAIVKHTVTGAGHAARAPTKLPLPGEMGRRRAQWGCLVAALFAGIVSTPPVIALIDARLDDTRRYEAVVALVGASRRCTATKIAARRFLTAGHCVADCPSRKPV